jgi:nitric oxide reductase subunit C
MLTENRRITITVLLVIAFLTYSFILYLEPPVKKGEVTGEAANGKWLWQKYNCTACHQVYGLGGYLGPDLTNVYSEKGPQYIRAFLQAGTTVMPDFRLSDADMNALTAYLKAIDASGKADPRTFTINNEGSIKQ